MIIFIQGEILLAYRLKSLELRTKSNDIGGKMRYFQIVLFFGAALSFIIALFFIGTVTGDILWRIGVSTLLFDVVCIMLWPDKPES